MVWQGRMAGPGGHTLPAPTLLSARAKELKRRLEQSAKRGVLFLKDL